MYWIKEFVSLEVLLLFRARIVKFWLLVYFNASRDKKGTRNKNKTLSPFHLSCAFYWDLSSSFQYEINSLPIIQLFTYWISIFSTPIAREKIKGLVILFKSISRNWKVKCNSSFQRLFQDCLTILLRSRWRTSVL